MSEHEPLGPLGRVGLELWDRAWQDRIWTAAQIELLQIACEQADERAALRFQVLSNPNPEDRRALRDLDRLIVANLTAIGYFVPAGPPPGPRAVPDAEDW